MYEENDKRISAKPIAEEKYDLNLRSNKLKPFKESNNKDKIEPKTSQVNNASCFIKKSEMDDFEEKNFEEKSHKLNKLKEITKPISSNLFVESKIVTGQTKTAHNTFNIKQTTNVFNTAAYNESSEYSTCSIEFEKAKVMQIFFLKIN